MRTLNHRVQQLESAMVPASMIVVLFKCFDDGEISGLQWSQHGYETLTTDRLPGEDLESLERRAVDATLRHVKACGIVLNGVASLAEVRGQCVCVQDKSMVAPGLGASRPGGSMGKLSSRPDKFESDRASETCYVARLVDGQLLPSAPGKQLAARVAVMPEVMNITEWERTYCFRDPQ